MSQNKDFTEFFFSWAASNGLSSRDIAEELGKSQVVISNWRSKCTPKGQEYACRAYMDKVEMLDILKNHKKPLAKIRKVLLGLERKGDNDCQIAPIETTREVT